MSKILKSVTLGDVKNGGIFRALGKEFVKLDADEHGCLVLAKDIWTRMPFRRRRPGMPQRSAPERDYAISG